MSQSKPLSSILARRLNAGAWDWRGSISGGPPTLIPTSIHIRSWLERLNEGGEITIFRLTDKYAYPAIGGYPSVGADQLGG